MKYIIEFEDEYSMNEGGMKYHQCKQVPYWSVSHGIIKNLTPYTEPELSNNSKELENKNGELISRQAAIEALRRKAWVVIRTA